MAVSMIGPKFYAWDRDGKPLAFGKVYTYKARTNDPKATYQSEDGVVANTNPVILNGEGYGNIYLDGSYKVVVKDKDDNEIWTEDPVTAQGGEEWVNCMTATYLSSTTFKISGNVTDKFEAGRRIRIDSNTATYAYSAILSSVFAGADTTVIITDAVVTTGIINVCTSIVSTGTKFHQIPLNTGIVYPVATVADLRLLEPTVDGQQFNLLEYNIGSGEGGGPCYYDSSDTTSADDGGSVFVTATGERIKRIFKNYNVVEFGATNYGRLDEILNTIIDIISTQVQSETYGDYTVKNVIEIPAGEYTLLAPVNSKPYVKIISTGFVFLNSLHRGHAISCTLDIDDPEIPPNVRFKQSWCIGTFLDGSTGGIRIWGGEITGSEPGNRYGSGVYISTTYPIANRSANARWEMQNVSIGGFKNGILIGTQNTYLGILNGCHIENNTHQIATEKGATVADSGENIRVTNCVIASGIGLLLTEPGFDFNFIGCSLDFNKRVVKIENSSAGYSTTLFTACYFEGTGVLCDNNALASHYRISLSNCWGLLAPSQNFNWFQGPMSLDIDGFEVRGLPRTDNISAGEELLMCDSEVKVLGCRMKYNAGIAPPVSVSRGVLADGVSFFTDSAVGDGFGSSDTPVAGWEKSYIAGMSTTIIDTDSFRFGKCLEISNVTPNAASLTILSKNIPLYVGSRLCGGLAVKTVDTTQTVLTAFGINFYDEDDNLISGDSYSPSFTITVADGWSIIPMASTSFDTAPAGTAYCKIKVTLAPDYGLLFGGVIVNDAS